MLMCEFLTAVHHKLLVKVVIYNNSAFRADPGWKRRRLACLRSRKELNYPVPRLCSPSRCLAVVTDLQLEARVN